MLKYFPLLLLLTGFRASAQINATLYDHGDSSIYLLPVNDTLSYISFTDLDNMNNTIHAAIVDREPYNRDLLRSYLLMTYRFKKDTLVLREVFGKRYLDASVEYSTQEEYPKGQFVVRFEAKPVVGREEVEWYDSLFVQMGDSIYLGAVNTTIYRFETLRPPKGKCRVRIFDAQGKVDYTVPVRIKKGVTGFMIRFARVESALHSFAPHLYLAQHFTDTVKTATGTHPLKIEMMDWMHYWTKQEVRYMNPKTVLREQ